MQTTCPTMAAISLLQLSVPSMGFHDRNCTSAMPAFLTMLEHVSFIATVYVLHDPSTQRDDLDPGKPTQPDVRPLSDRSCSVPML